MLPDPSRPFVPQFRSSAVPQFRSSAVPQFRSLAAGGPLASLACVLAGAMATGALEGRAALYAAAFAGLSPLVLLMTAILMRIGGMETDGVQLRDLARGGVATQVTSVVLALAGQSIAGVPPRDLDGALLARGLELADGNDTLEPALAGYPHLLAALHADDLGDAAGYDRHMARVAVLACAMQPPARAVRDRVGLPCRARRQRRGGADRISHAAGGIVESSDRYRAEAAVAVLEQRHPDARNALAQARAGLARSIDPGGALWAGDQLDRLEAQLHG